VVSKIFQLGGPAITQILGTHAVGKTTLMDFLEGFFKGRGYRVSTVRESSRECPFPINEMSTVEAQDWILEDYARNLWGTVLDMDPAEIPIQDKILLFQVLESKVRESSVADIVITDRGTLDNERYWKRVAEGKRTPQEISEHFDEWGIIRTVDWADYVFHVRKFSIESELMRRLLYDGQRSVDIEFRNEMAESILQGLRELESQHPEVFVRHLYSGFDRPCVTAEEVLQAKEGVMTHLAYYAGEVICPTIKPRQIARLSNGGGTKPL
jgi:hypothetical protein